MHLLIRDQGSDHGVEVVDIALDLLIPKEGERMQPDVLIERFQGQMEDALQDGMLQVDRRGKHNGVHDLLLLR